MSSLQGALAPGLSTGHACSKAFNEDIWLKSFPQDPLARWLPTRVARLRTLYKACLLQTSLRDSLSTTWSMSESLLQGAYAKVPTSGCASCRASTARCLRQGAYIRVCFVRGPLFQGTYTEVPTPMSGSRKGHSEVLTPGCLPRVYVPLVPPVLQVPRAQEQIVSQDRRTSRPSFFDTAAYAEDPTPAGAESHDPSPMSPTNPTSSASPTSPGSDSPPRRSSWTHVQTKFFGHCSQHQEYHSQESPLKGRQIPYIRR